MTPYARKFFQFLSIPFVLGFLGQAYGLYSKLPIAPELFWSAMALVIVASAALAYYRAVGELRDVCGLFMPVSRLRNSGAQGFETLGVKKYRPFYISRPGDEILKARILQKKGAVVAGRPLAGKTRAAVEAVIAALPLAHILRIAPASFERDDIEKLIIPCPWVIFGKPTVVLFIDNLTGDHAHIVEGVVTRLADQTSDIYIVSTCGTDGAASIEPLKRTALSHKFDILGLDALTPSESAQLMFESWKGQGQPILSDVSLPGYVVLGSNPVAGRIRKLSATERKYVQALRIAACSADLSCASSLFWSIAVDVLGVDPGVDRAAVLKGFAGNDMFLLSGNPQRITAQHVSYLDEAYLDYTSFIADLDGYVRWLSSKGDTKRLGNVAAHCLYVVANGELAKQALEASVASGTTDPSHFVALAGLHAGANDSVQEEATLQRALALVSSKADRALQLISHGDTLLYRLARPSVSLGFYNRAYYEIEHEPEGPALDLVRRRSGDNLLVLRDYAAALPYCAAWRHSAKPEEVLDAAERVSLCLLGQGKDPDAREELRPLWHVLNAGERQQRAIQLLDDAEGCLDDDKYALATLVVFDLLRGSGLLEAVTQELTDFANAAYDSGLILASEIANGFLAKLSQPELRPANQAAALINLGVAQTDLGKLVEARASLGAAKNVALANASASIFTSAVESGLGDLSALEGNLPDARSRYVEALALAEKIQDDNQSNWARLGLAEIAVLQKNFAEAEGHILKVERYLGSYQEAMRNLLVRARVKLHFEQVDDARSLVARGLLYKRRRHLAKLQGELIALSGELNDKPSARNAA